MYVSPKGWHEAGDELRVWAEVGRAGGSADAAPEEEGQSAAPEVMWQVSLLPECTPAATRESIDRCATELCLWACPCPPRKAPWSRHTLPLT